ncbi:hypothetical protein SAMN06265377_3525 [Flagellimonas pacifica]|uniref:Outer membrane lipoprotein carrier protein LolA n=2 Tax=Flavobacteriaceae TaxID=49546 RepID=A0A285MYD2_9FLAO|nr:hypothetical protein SAMN06265377_3525 [Allomuricauda parva]
MDCKEKLMSYLNRMESMSAPKNGQVYHVRYSMETKFSSNSGVESKTTDTEVFTTANKIAVYDSNMSVFGDEKDIFVVLPEHGKIYWNNSDPRIFNDINTYRKFLEIQRTLLDSAETVDCVHKDNGLTLITVIPNADFAKRTKLVQQKITYDPKKDKIVSVENGYNGQSKIKKQRITYEKMDFDSPKEIISPVAALFKGHQLKPAYKGFEIIDNRKN